jgi:hypothetical protein
VAWAVFFILNLEQQDEPPPSLSFVLLNGRDGLLLFIVAVVSLRGVEQLISV